MTCWYKIYKVTVDVNLIVKVTLVWKQIWLEGKLWVQHDSDFVTQNIKKIFSCNSVSVYMHTPFWFLCLFWKRQYSNSAVYRPNKQCTSTNIPDFMQLCILYCFSTMDGSWRGRCCIIYANPKTCWYPSFSLRSKVGQFLPPTRNVISSLYQKTLHSE